jgi:hypothetical protein
MPGVTFALFFIDHLVASSRFSAPRDKQRLRGELHKP